MFSKRFMLFPTFKKKIGVKKNSEGGKKISGGGGGVLNINIKKKYY